MLRWRVGAENRGGRGGERGRSRGGSWAQHWVLTHTVRLSRPPRWPPSNVHARTLGFRTLAVINS
eukprot:scaffold168148_cov19-Tisochrysis_lutea.AAC.1